MAVATITMFTEKQRASLDATKIPRHIAIIPDGNRRWAKRQEFSCQKGHESGANVLIQTVKAAKELGIKTVTFYVFSTENWSRPKDEIAAFMWLLQEFLISHRDEMKEDGVRLHAIGELDALPEEVFEAIIATSEATQECSDINLVLAVNYGGRKEICHVVDMILNDERRGLRRGPVAEEEFARYLSTTPWGDPDLLIRTSGEMRISNFLLWQLSYAEIHITEVLWPDFKPVDLLDAIVDFQRRERRLGGT